MALCIGMTPALITDAWPEIIRPKGNFLGLTSRSLGWSEVVVGGGLEIHELPVYPKGILVEPFCRLLAEALKLCLQ